MQAVLRVSFVTMALAFAIPSGAAVVTSAVNPANSNVYHLLESASWADSETAANVLGGNLVTVDDAAENEWIYQTFLAGTNRVGLWIGLNDVAVEGTFVWASGSSSPFRRWAPTEPNDLANEDYVFMYGPWAESIASMWNDEDGDGILQATNGSQIYGLVEVEAVPEPASGLLIGSAFCALFLIARKRS